MSRIVLHCTTALILLAVTGPAQSKVINATAKTIAAVWTAAKPGDTIKLSGKFGLTRLQYKSSGKAITLDATSAVFTDSLMINQVDGLKIVGGTFGKTGGTATKYGRAVVIYGGSSIAFYSPTVVSDAGGQGIAFNDTVGASVKSGNFAGLYSAISLTRVKNGYLSGNAITRSLSDGIDIADSHNVTATYNSCSAGTPVAGAHPDCIQMWSVAGHAVQSDIAIIHNTATGPTQGFTSFDATKGGGLRLSIMYNRVATSYSQGIACYACVDSNISYNRVTTLAGSAHLTNINVIGGNHNTVIGNTIGALPKSPHAAAARLFDASATFDDASPMADVGAIPEPASWLMLVVGFGIVGSAVRRSRRFATA